MLKYPWEAEIEEAEAGEKVVENNWKSVAQTRVDEIGKYGLEYWVYFQAVKALSITFAFVSLLAVPKLTFVLQGSAIQQQDFFAWVARLSLGNVHASTELQLGLVELGLVNSPLLGFLDVLQLVGPLAFVLWFRYFHIPRLATNPELRSLSAADYALQVWGMPKRLPDETANQKYDFELARHFETVLRGLDGADPNALVCEVALARDFSGALLDAQERSRAELQLRQLQESAKLAPSREERLRRSIAALSSSMSSKRAEESERPVWCAYVVLSTEEERARLLRAYRLPRCLQPRALRFDRRWPLRVAAAPEPGEIVWAHCRLSPCSRCARRLLTLLGLGLLLGAGACFALLAYWALLGTRGAAATQCSPRGGLADALAPCLMPASQELTGEVQPGCDCLCLTPAQWRSSAVTCRELGSNGSAAAVMLCALVAELAHLLLGYLVPPVVERWRLSLSSNTERCKLLLMAASCSFVPLLPSAAYFAWKALVATDPPKGLAEPLRWELDTGWYLHAAPSAALWCLGRWLSPFLSACSTCCRAGHVGHRVLLWESWASLASVVAVSTALQPLLPYLAPMATLGLVARYWSEKYVFLRGNVIVRSGTPTSTTERLVHAAFAVLWLAVAVGAALAAWAYGTGLALQDRLRGPALPVLCLFCVALALWAVAALAPSCSGGGGATASTLNFQEAWLMMRHSDILATYQMHEHPPFRGTTILKELQPDVSAERERLPTASHWRRNLDTLPSLALVGEKAPTRSRGK